MEHHLPQLLKLLPGVVSLKVALVQELAQQSGQGTVQLDHTPPGEAMSYADGGEDLVLDFGH